LSPQGSSCARAADATKTAAKAMAIAERNLSLLLASERSVKVHTDAHGMAALEPRIAGGRRLFQVVDELGDRAPRQRRLLQLRDVPAAMQHLHARSPDAREILDTAQRQQPILRSPENEDRYVDVGEHVQSERAVVPRAR